MDKQHDHIESKQISNRPRWLTLCMMATAASVIVLAGCGDNEEAPPAEEPSPLEQDATTQPEPGMSEEPAMEQDPGLSEEPAAENSMTQSEETMSEDPMSEESMPDDTMDEPAEGTMNPDDEPGFGEGTEPMPGAEEEDENSTSN